MKFISSVVPRIVVICVLFSSSATLPGQGIKGMTEEFRLEVEELKLVDLAITEFRNKGFGEHNLNRLPYTLSVRRIENGYVAIFGDSKIDPYRLGSPPGAMVGFEVIIDNNYQVVRSNLVR